MPDRDPALRIHESFARQGLMRTLGASLAGVAPGAVSLRAPIRPESCQQHGAAHAGLTFALGDTAAGYAALSLMPDESEVMTAEIKINLLRPAVGKVLEARGKVLKAGRRLCVVQADVFALDDAGAENHVATLLGTMVPVAP